MMFTIAKVYRHGDTCHNRILIIEEESIHAIFFV